MGKLIIDMLKVKNKLFKYVLFKRDKGLLFENRNLCELFRRGDTTLNFPLGQFNVKLVKTL